MLTSPSTPIPIFFMELNIFRPFQIIIVTLCYRPRRRDTVTLNSVNFSTANLFLTIYAVVLFGKGIAYHGDYHHSMYSWLNNPGCGMVGYMLIAGTLATSIFYMLEVSGIICKCISSLWRQKGLTGYCFKYIDRPFRLRNDDFPSA